MMKSIRKLAGAAWHSFVGSRRAKELPAGTRGLKRCSRRAELAKPRGQKLRGKRPASRYEVHSEYQAFISVL